MSNNGSNSPVCILGMHRSGTSMVAKLLHLAGVYLGEESDLMPAKPENADGFWEHLKFVNINDHVLSALGGGWDFVPDAAAWQDVDLAHLTSDVLAVSKEFEKHEPWGWKDPRNSLTLPFWLRFFPELRAVICLRNPLEVAMSLRRRNYLSLALSLDLWEGYNRQILEVIPPGKRIITHYDAYFEDSRAEVRRIVAFLGIPASDDVIERACSAPSPRLRHNEFATKDLREMGVSRRLQNLYAAMCQEAGRNEGDGRYDEDGDRPARASRYSKSQLNLDVLVAKLEEQSARAKCMVEELTKCYGTIQELGTKLEQVSAWAKRSAEDVAQRDQTIQDLHAQLGLVEILFEGASGELRQKAADLRKQLAYKQLVRRLREIVGTAVPPDSTLLIVSKGDDELLKLDGRKGWHFPQTADGVYAGHSPAGSVSAIAHLEALRAKGADFLLLPATTFWWLDHYEQFKQHLQHRYRLLLRQDDVCAIYSLREAPPSQTTSAWSRLDEVVAHFENVFDRQPTILDWDTGLELAARFPQHTVFEPPAPDELPYLDGTVDLVAVRAPSDQMLAEANRVADAGVLVFSNGRDADDSALSLEVVGRLGSHEAAAAHVSIVVPLADGRVPSESWLRDLRGSLPSDFCGEIVLAHGLTGDAGPELPRLVEGKSWVTVQHYPGESASVLSNNAANTAIGDILIFLDFETVPLPGWLPPLVRTFRDHADAGAVAVKLLLPDGRLQEAGREILADGSSAAIGSGQFDCEAPDHNYVREVDCGSNPALATRRSSFQDAGGLDTAYEDVQFAYADYCMKLRQKDLRVYYQPQSRVVQIRAGETDDGDGDTSRRLFLDRWSTVLHERRPSTGSFDLVAFAQLGAD